MKIHRPLMWLPLVSVLLFSCKQVKGRPELHIDNPVINLQEISYDSVTTIQYALINKGKDVLVIDTATASCGCTIPLIKKRNISPGDSTLLLIEYKPVDTGYFDKKVVIKSNIDSSFTIVSFNGRAIK